MTTFNSIKTSTLFANRYRLETRLGGGGFSEVWLAYDTISQNKVALKIYMQAGGLDEEGIKMFRNEFSIVCNFNHSNLLRPFSFEIVDNHPYLVLPFCKKGSAAKLIGQISEDDLWKFIHDVASGLDYLHSHNGQPIVHQDIKPANILIDHNGQFIITDFGISTGLQLTLSRNAANSDNDGSGTIAYMAPERFGINVKPLISNDIWSLGATLYELATGVLPFGEFGGLTQSKAHTPPEIKGNYSKKLKELIYTCLSEHPWERPSAKDILTDKWKPIKRRFHISKKIKRAGIASAFFASLCAALVIFNSKGAPHPVDDEILRKQAHNDSLMLAQIHEACAIAEEEHQAAAGIIENINEDKLLQAAEMYLQAMNIEATDSIKDVARRRWNDMPQKIIDDTYRHFSTKAATYYSIEAFDAASLFNQRKDKLEKFINPN